MATPAPTPAPLSKGATFGTAGLGGVIAWTAIHPFNTLAVRMSLSTGEKMSLSGYAVDMVKKEGVGSLYKGLGAGVVRQIFYATSRFGLFEVFRDQIAAQRGGEVDFFTRLVAGSVSGGCAALISCPAEVSLVRMSNDAALPENQRRNYTSVFNAFSRTAKEEGLTAFWRGSTPFCTRCVIVGCFQVATYDQIKQLVKKQTGYSTNSLANVAFSANCASLIYSVWEKGVFRVSRRCGLCVHIVRQPSVMQGSLPHLLFLELLCKPPFCSFFLA